MDKTKDRTKDKTKHYLLIDGYNIIFAWDNLKELALASLDMARRKLMDILSNMAGLTEETVILVFDAHKVNEGVEMVEEYSNIIVVYTKEKETADTYIERSVKILASKYSVRVATSDIAEQIIIIGAGARVVSALALKEEIEIQKKDTEKILGDKPVKANMLIDNVDEETMRLLEEMRLKGS